MAAQSEDPRADVDVVEEERVKNVLFSRLFGSADPVRVGRFHVLERVGAGAMGIVYAAYDPELDRRVAVKILRHADPSSDARTLAEARSMASVNHPNVAQVFEVGDHDGRIFIAMEFVQGRTLRAWQAEGERSWRDVVGMYLDAGRGLAAAHAAGLVHRDFKPDNVLVGEDRVRVVDFGLARAEATAHATFDPRGGASGPGQAPTGSVGGTPMYMAPEQHGGAVVDAQSDQYAYCVALFEALYGTLPFVGESVDALGASKRAGDVVSFDQRRAPQRIHDVVARGLAPDPRDRHPSMDALLRELAWIRHDGAGGCCWLWPVPSSPRARWAWG